MNIEQLAELTTRYKLLKKQAEEIDAELEQLKGSIFEISENTPFSINGVVLSEFKRAAYLNTKALISHYQLTEDDLKPFYTYYEPTMRLTIKRTIEL
jgi:hypothetical protein